jgi:allantoinase
VEVDLLLSGARIATADGEVPGGVAIDQGRIVAIVPPGETAPTARRAVDLAGDLLLPGVIDTHTHARDPSVDRREDFETATAAAAAGGITTILEMPISSPAVSDAAVWRRRLAIVEPKAHVDFGLYGGAGADNLADIESLAAIGAVAFKTFRTPRPVGREAEFVGLVATTAAEHLAALRVVARTGLVSVIHAEDPQLLVAGELELRGGGAVERGASIHARWRPPVVEESSVAQSLELARAAGARIQVAHASTPHTVELVSRARSDGVAATVETCPHYLFLDESALDVHGGFAKINPPLRPIELVEGLWDRVRAGEVDVVGSDHSPFLREEKLPPDGDVWKALPGAPGLEAMLPLLLTAVEDGWLTIGRLLALTSGNAARIFGLPAKGRLAVGADADFAVVETGGRWQLDPSTWLTRSRDTAAIWAGRQVRARVRSTWVRGECVWDAATGALGPPGWGQVVRPASAT